MGIPPTRLSLVGSGSSPHPAGAPSFLETALPRVLSLDAHGRILDWMHWQDAVCLYVRGAVAWTLGEPCLVVRGGTNRASGLQSFVELHPIVAGRSHAQAKALDPSPSLSNTALFARDGTPIGGVGVSGASSEFDAECGTRAAEAAGLRVSRPEPGSE